MKKSLVREMMEGLMALFMPTESGFTTKEIIVFYSSLLMFLVLAGILGAFSSH